MFLLTPRTTLPQRDSVCQLSTWRGGCQHHSPCSPLPPPFSCRCLWDTSASSSFATCTSDASPPRPAAELRNVRSVDSATGHLVGPCSSCDRPSPIQPSYMCTHNRSIRAQHSHPASPPPHTHTTHPCYHNLATLQLQFSRTASNHRALPAAHLILRLQLDRCLAVSLGLGPALNCSLRLRWVFPGKVSIPAPTNKSLSSDCKVTGKNKRLTMRLQLFRNFLAENSGSLLGFLTISRWAQMFFTD